MCLHVLEHTTFISSYVISLRKLTTWTRLGLQEMSQESLQHFFRIRRHLLMSLDILHLDMFHLELNTNFQWGVYQYMLIYPGKSSPLAVYTRISWLILEYTVLSFYILSKGQDISVYTRISQYSYRLPRICQDQSVCPGTKQVEKLHDLGN